MTVTQLIEPTLFVYHVNYNGSHYVLAENALHALKLYATHINADSDALDTMQVEMNYIPRHVWDCVRTRKGRLDLLISERGQFAGVL